MKQRAKIFSVFLLIISSLIFNFFISRHYFHKDLEPDEVLYNSIALSILDGRNTFGFEGRQIDIGQEVTPFYSAMVSGAYLIDKAEWSPLVLNIVLSCATLILLFLIIIRITGKLIFSFLSVLVFSLYFPLWAYNFFIMMEILTIFLLSLSVFFILLYLKENRKLYLFLASIIFSVLVLVNNRFFVLLGVFFLLVLYQSFFAKTLAFKNAIYSFLISIVIIGPWFIRQIVVYDQFVFFTPKWNNLVSEKVGIFKSVNFTSIEDMSDSYKLMDYDYYLKGIENDKNNFSNTKIKFTPVKFQETIIGRERIRNIYLARIVRYFTLFDTDYKFLYPDSYRMTVPSSFPYKIIQVFVLLPLFVFSFVGFIIAIYRKELFILCLSVFWFSHIFLHALIHYIDRYRLTILPVLLIISAYGLFELLKGFKITRGAIYPTL